MELEISLTANFNGRGEKKINIQQGEMWRNLNSDRIGLRNVYFYEVCQNEHKYGLFKDSVLKGRVNGRVTILNI